MKVSKHETKYGTMPHEICNSVWHYTLKQKKCKSKFVCGSSQNIELSIFSHKEYRQILAN